MLTYDSKAGFAETTIAIAHSVIPGALGRKEFWLFFGLHLVIFAANRLGLMSSADDKKDVFYMDWSEIHIITAMTTFFEVFYTNTCYARYTLLYNITRNLLNVVSEYAFLARLYMRPSGRPYDRVACRWLCASLLMSLHEITQERDLSPQEWMRLLSLGLLKREEVDFLRGLKSQQRMWVILHAAGDVGRLGLVEAKAPANISKELTHALLEFRKYTDQVRDMLNNPIPFGYFHLLCMMLTLNLGMWAWAMGVSESLFAPLFFFFSALIFVGMLDLASLLSNPFGTDEVDFPVHAWVHQALEIVTAILNYEHSSAVSNWEAELEEETQFRTRLLLKTDEIGDFLGCNGALINDQFHESDPLAMLDLEEALLQAAVLQQRSGSPVESHLNGQWQGPRRAQVPPDAVRGSTGGYAALLRSEDVGAAASRGR